MISHKGSQILNIERFVFIGAWSHLYEGEDINCITTSHDNSYVAVGENLGAIKFYKYPCATYKVIQTYEFLFSVRYDFFKFFIASLLFHCW